MKRTRERRGVPQRSGVSIMVLGEDGASSGKGGGTEWAYYRILLQRLGIEDYISNVKPPNHNGTIDTIITLAPTANHTWVLIDADFQSAASSGSHTPEQFSKIEKWSNDVTKQGERHIIISAPRFEYWLLLHFVDVSVAGNRAGDDSEVKKIIPNFTKNMQQCARLFNRDNILHATMQARNGCQPSCSIYYQKDAERDMRGTLMWKFVDFFISETLKRSAPQGQTGGTP